MHKSKCTLPPPWTLGHLRADHSSCRRERRPYIGRGPGRPQYTWRGGGFTSSWADWLCMAPRHIGPVVQRDAISSIETFFLWSMAIGSPPALPHANFLHSSD